VTFDAVAGAPTDIPARTSGSASKQFNTAGAFTYHCAIHPAMTGTVNVVP